VAYLPLLRGEYPRTLLQLPTWSYSTGAGDLYVNLFIGGTMTSTSFLGTDVEMVQKTDYPWDGKVAIAVNPGTPGTLPCGCACRIIRSARCT